MCMYTRRRVELMLNAWAAAACRGWCSTYIRNQFAEQRFWRSYCLYRGWFAIKNARTHTYIRSRRNLAVQSDYPDNIRNAQCSPLHTASTALQIPVLSHRCCNL